MNSIILKNDTETKTISLPEGNCKATIELKIEGVNINYSFEDKTQYENFISYLNLNNFVEAKNFNATEIFATDKVFIKSKIWYANFIDIDLIEFEGKNIVSVKFATTEI